MEKYSINYFKGFFTPYYQLVKPDLDKISTEVIRANSSLYKSLVRAAFTKCFEFNYFVCQPKKFDASFFALSSLRSICEDLIALCYLKKLPAAERNELLQFEYDYETTKSLILQYSFFRKYNPGQLTIDPVQYAGHPFCQFVMQNKNKKKLSNKTLKRLPSVFKMAKETSYSDLYDFIYYATSSNVHFRTDTLLKLGWTPSESKVDTNKYQYSVYHYKDYYAMFNMVYGSILFYEFVDRFKSTLSLSKGFINDTRYFRESFELFDWPEIFTHDHLAIPKPSFMQVRLNRALAVTNTSVRKKFRIR